MLACLSRHEVAGKSCRRMGFCGFSNEMALTPALAGATVLVPWGTLTLLGAVAIPKAKKHMSSPKGTFVTYQLLKAVSMLIYPLS